MHLLYVDESGSVPDASQRYFVLAGVSVFERSTHWVEQNLNAIAARFNPASPHAMELHGAPMYAGRNEWRSVTKNDRVQAIKDALKEGVVNFRRNGVTLFAIVIDKNSMAGTDSVEYAFECLTQRFDLLLTRLYTKHQDPQRGLMIFDKSSTEQRIQTLAREFKYNGHTQGRTRNYAEVPVFLDSKASRLIQLADLVAYAVFRKFERGDDQFFDIIKDCFDSEGGVAHGFHIKQ